jgi:hypothetical protein
VEAVVAAGGATIVPASTVEAARAEVEAREKEIGGSGGSLEPSGPLITQLHSVCMGYSESLPTLLHPLAERTCYSLQVEAARPSAEPSVAAGATLSVRPHKRAVLVTGDTQLVKEQLRALKGSWNKALQGWIFKWGSGALSFQKQRR